MYKLKYYSLNKEEQKNIKNEFYNTDLGKNINFRLKRLLFIGIIGILFSIYLFIFRKNIWDLISSISLFIISIIFIISSYKIRIRKINEYLVKKK